MLHLAYSLWASTQKAAAYRSGLTGLLALAVAVVANIALGYYRG